MRTFARRIGVVGLIAISSCAAGRREGLPAALPLSASPLSRDRIERQGYFDAEEIEKLKARYGTPGFFLSLPLEEDLLMVVLTFSLFLEEFELPSL